MNIAAQILEIAISSSKMVTTAESCTGGMVAARLTDLPGSSALMERGFVTYTNAAKREMLGVTAQSLDAYGAVSEQVALEMARGALARSHAQIACAITGIAGPGGSDHKPEGRVCFAIATDASAHAETVEFGPLGRDIVRAAACDHALKLIHAALQT
ncbi:MAG: CinA family protein [Sulfitobacter sp.]